MKNSDPDMTEISGSRSETLISSLFNIKSGLKKLAWLKVLKQNQDPEELDPDLTKISGFKLCFFLSVQY